jgi:hypothetical protein
MHDEYGPVHDPLHGIDPGPCDDFAPDTLGDDPHVCTTCFYAGIDHRGLTRPHIPTTDYYDGRDGSIEADDGLTDDERIEAQDAREEWTDFLEWQKGLGA